jgi:hypothetical protein
MYLSIYEKTRYVAFVRVALKKQVEAIICIMYLLTHI